MPSKKSTGDQRAFYKMRVKKLQRLGLLGKVDLKKKASPSIIRTIEKYSDVLRGKAQVVQSPHAKETRKKFGFRGKGDLVVIPKEKGEKFSISKRSGDLTSRRKTESGIIKKTVSEKFKPRPANANVYYTLPERKRGLGRIKRKTFANFDELLYYLQSYEINFEDVEDFIEVEEIERGTRRDKIRRNKITRERAAAIKRKRGRKSKRGRKPRRK